MVSSSASTSKPIEQVRTGLRLASAISAFYYLRVVKVMYFDEPKDEFVAVPGELNVIMAVFGFLIVTFYFTVGNPLANLAHTAAGSLF